MKKETWKKSPWLLALAPALIPIIYDISKSNPFYTSLWTALKWIYNLVITVLVFDLKVWWVLLFLAVSFLAIYMFLKLNEAKLANPDYCNYKEDTFIKWKWSWGWNKNSYNNWVISNIKAHCPECDTPMIPYTTYGQPVGYSCPRCNFEPSTKQFEESYKITAIIHDNIERGVYKSKITAGK